jgi:ribose transport system ATP-binding protein
MLHAEGIRKSFGGVEVLHGVDLDAPGGEILALLGENGAGKSTLVKVFAGELVSDSGTVTIDGQSYAQLDPLRARGAGVRMILQELSDARDLTVCENVMLGRWPGRRGLVSWREIHAQARTILETMGVQVDLDARVGSLSHSQRQVVELARALADRGRCLILDEPTAALSSTEVEALFAALRRLREGGVAIIYITHRLDEVARIADRVQVLRDGRTALTGSARELSRANLVSAMVGEDVGAVTRPQDVAQVQHDAPALRMRAAGRPREFADVNLDVYPGEIVALYGKLGSGNDAVIQSAFGATQLGSGAVEVGGQAVEVRDVREAIAAGVGFLPGDRRNEGVFAELSAAANISAPSWRRMGGFLGLISRAAELRTFRRWCKVLGIRSTGDGNQLVSTLSGGNQQKVMLGRWLECQSDVLLMINPTQGIDVGARTDLYGALRALCREGRAVLAATSDCEEVVQLADRAVVMSRGRIVARLDSNQITEDRLIALAGG